MSQRRCDLFTLQRHAAVAGSPVFVRPQPLLRLTKIYANRHIGSFNLLTGVPAIAFMRVLWPAPRPR